MRRLPFLIGLLALAAPTLAITPQNMPPPVTTRSATTAASAAPAAANRGPVAPASTRAYVGPAKVKSWTKATSANAAPATKFAATAGADDSSGLRKGTLEAINPAGSTFHVLGQQLTFDAKQVRVFARGGKPASVAQLRAGANVRFTMDPADSQKRRVAVIYVD